MSIYTFEDDNGIDDPEFCFEDLLNNNKNTSNKNKLEKYSNCLIPKNYQIAFNDPIDLLNFSKPKSKPKLIQKTNLSNDKSSNDSNSSDSDLSIEVLRNSHQVRENDSRGTDSLFETELESDSENENMMMYKETEDKTPMFQFFDNNLTKSLSFNEFFNTTKDEEDSFQFLDIEDEESVELIDRSSRVKLIDKSSNVNKKLKLNDIFDYYPIENQFFGKDDKYFDSKKVSKYISKGLFSIKHKFIYKLRNKKIHNKFFVLKTQCLVTGCHHS